MPKGRNSTGNLGVDLQHRFSEVARAEIQRSVFDRSCGLKTAFDSGYLVPIFVDEALPGDTMKMRVESFVRMATPIYPLLDNLKLDFFFFAVPNRLVWDNWQKFCGEQRNPGDSTDFLVPQMAETVAVGSLSDYFGLRTGISDLTFNSLHHRAYNLIWNEWFRDENLQDSVVVDTDDGPDDPTDYVLLRRGKRHDYFTSCLPFPQKGDPVELPLGTTAPISGTAAGTISGNGVPTFDLSGTTGVNLSGGNASDDADWSAAIGLVGQGPFDAQWNDPKLTFTGTSLTGTADLSSATAATINDIRRAFQIQRLLERDARGGTRYTELLRSHFGVISPDQRLQRPEYLGGGSVPINVHPVPNMTQPTTNLGRLGAFVTSAGGVQWFKSFTEHSVVIGLCSVRADLTYQQGLPRMFSRQTRYDFYWPALAHLGEQAVLNKEIFVQGTSADDDVFGYQERFSEYRYKPSQVTGVMRSDAPTSIDEWHLALDFASLPALNATFIEDNPPVARVVQIDTEPEFFGDFFFNFRCARPMPTFAVPGLIDHF